MENDSENSPNEFLINVGSDHFGNTKSEIEERSERNSRLSFSSSFSALQNHPTNSAYLTCFLLINTMIGSGILNQPFVFKESGIIGGCLGFVIASVATWVALLCMTEVGIKEGVLEYSGLAKRAFHKNGERIVDLSIILLTFGAQLGYILVVGTTLSGLLHSWGCNNVMCDNILTTIVAVGLFVLPVCLFRHFGHLAWLSLFSVAAIVAVLLLVIVGGPIKHKIEHYDSDYQMFNMSGMLKSTGSIVFSLACASANFQAFVSTEKKSQNMTSWSWVTGMAVFLGAAMCAAMGIAGYLSFGSDTEGVILDNFPQHGFDFFKVMVVTHLILYIPVNFVIMRYSIVKLFSGLRSELLPTTTHTLLTTLFLVLTTGVVIMLISLGLSSGAAFSLILNITGGIGGSLSTFLLPAAIYLKLMPTDSKLYNHARALFVLGSFVMVAVIVETILGFPFAIIIENLKKTSETDKSADLLGRYSSFSFNCYSTLMSVVVKVSVDVCEPDRDVEEFDNYCDSDDEPDFMPDSSKKQCVDSTISTSVSTYIRKRRNRKTRDFVPRILKRDIRNIFTSMFANVLNLMDYKLCEGFFNEYCTPNLSYEYDMAFPMATHLQQINPNTVKYINIVTSSMAAKYVHATSQAFPDMTMNITNSRIIQQPHSEESQIVANFVMKGTKVHSTKWTEVMFSNNADNNNTNTTTNNNKQMMQYNSTLETLISSPLYELECTTISGRKGMLRGYTSEQYLKMTEMSPLLPDPVLVTVNGTIHMTLDANKRLTNFSLQYVNASYRPSKSEVCIDL